MLLAACAFFVIWQLEGWLCSEVVQVASPKYSFQRLYQFSIIREFSGREIILSLFLISSICPVMWAPAWPPTFLFFVSRLRHLSLPGVSLCISVHPHPGWAHSFTGFLLAVLIVPSFVGIIDPLLCRSRWMNWFIALKKNLPSSLFYCTRL